jgi:hypothetical protein
LLEFVGKGDYKPTKHMLEGGGKGEDKPKERENKFY